MDDNSVMQHSKLILSEFLNDLFKLKKERKEIIASLRHKLERKKVETLQKRLDTL